MPAEVAVKVKARVWKIPIPGGDSMTISSMPRAAEAKRRTVGRGCVSVLCLTAKHQAVCACLTPRI